MSLNQVIGHLRVNMEYFFIIILLLLYAKKFFLMPKIAQFICPMHGCELFFTFTLLFRANQIATGGAIFQIFNPINQT